MKIKKINIALAGFGNIGSNFYKILEKKRLLEARFLSMLPKNIKDKKLEKKYKDIMSASGKAPEIMPGGTEGAIGETTSA